MKKLALVGFLLFSSCNTTSSTRCPEIQSKRATVLRVHNHDTVINGEPTGGNYGSAVVVDCIKNTDNTYTVYLLTAHHVVANIVAGQYTHIEDTIKEGVPMLAPSNEYVYTVVRSLPSIDIAILKAITDRPYVPAKLQQTKVTTWQRLYTLGYPIGGGLHITTGIASYYDATEGMWVTNAQAIYGSSGGGVFNEDTNELIGIVSQISVYYSGPFGETHPIPFLHSFVPVDKFLPFVEETLLWESQEK